MPPALIQSLAWATRSRRGTTASIELQVLGLLHSELIALEQEAQCIAGRHHTGDPLRPAGAGKQSDLDLGEPQSAVDVLRRDAVVAGEAKLETAAERGARDRRHPRLAAGLEPPVEQRELAALLEEDGDGGLVTARLPPVTRSGTRWRIGESVATERLQHGEVGPGAERVLARGDDRALDRGLARHLLDDIGELREDRAGR